MLARTPNRPNQPNAVGKGNQIADKADEFRAGIDAHHDGRTNNQRAGDDAHG